MDASRRGPQQCNEQIALTTEHAVIMAFKLENRISRRGALARGAGGRTRTDADASGHLINRLHPTAPIDVTSLITLANATFNCGL